MWGRSERVIVTSGLSKAYGLPGLRIGWMVAPPALAASFWSYHDYTTIAPGALSDLLARIALDPARRPSIIERTRRDHPDELPVIRDWLISHGDAFPHVPPEAGAIVVRRVSTRDQLDRTGDAAARHAERAASSLAITSTWTGTCASDSASETAHLVEGLRRLHLLLETAPV